MLNAYTHLHALASPTCMITLGQRLRQRNIVQNRLLTRSYLIKRTHTYSRAFVQICEHALRLAPNAMYVHKSGQTQANMYLSVSWCTTLSRVFFEHYLVGAGVFPKLCMGPKQCVQMSICVLTGFVRYLCRVGVEGYMLYVF